MNVTYPSPNEAIISSNPSGVAPGTYGSETMVAQIQVDTYGRVLDAVDVPIDFPDPVSIDSSTLSVTGGPDYTVNLTSGIATPGTYGSSSLVPSVSVDTYGRVTNVTTNAIATPTKDMWIFFTPTSHQTGSGVSLGMCLHGTESIVSTPSPVAGTITELSAYFTNVLAVSLTTNLWKNGATTGQQFSIAAGSLSGSMSLSVPVAIGDRFSVFVTLPGALANGYMAWARIVYN